MNLYRSLLTLVAFFYSVCSLAQPSIPPDPGGGVGAVGPGEAAISIDGNIITLVFVAVLFVVYFAKNYTKKLN